MAPPTPPIGLGPSAATPPATPAGTRCPRCGASNDAGVRFCVVCGNSFAPPSPPVPVVSAKPAAPSPPPLHTAPIAPSPVLGIGPTANGGETRICDRCRGATEAGAQFCKFCGAPLGGARANPPKAQAPLPAPVALAPLPSALDAPRPVNPQPARDLVPGATPMIPPPPDTSQFQPASTHATEKVYGRLIVITKDGAEGPSYPIHEQLDLGRSEGQVVISEDRYLSPRHARLVRRVAANGEAELVLRDLGSTNGIFLRLGNALRGDGRVEVPLQDQDLFLVGQQVLRFEAVKDAEDGLGPATQHGTLLFGTPSAPRYARLSQRTTEGVARDVYHVRKVETVLGRESGDIVFTEDPFLSRRHALVRVDRERKAFTLADLGSSNGTFIQIRGEVSIKSGDQFRVGQQLFRIELA